MNIAEIESQLRELVEAPFDPDSFVFSFIEIYQAPKATVTKLKQGSTNPAKGVGGVLWKKRLFFKAVEVGEADVVVEAMAADALTKKHGVRFVFATDGVDVRCRDLQADSPLDIEFDRLNDHFDFFLPLAGIETYQGVSENPADVKATGRLAKLYDEILAFNPEWRDAERSHDLNLFMARLLFCMFAEDTSIFEPGLFLKTVMSMTKEDGTNVHEVLDSLFTAMDTPQERRSGAEFANRFPFVNGGLFRERAPIPRFSGRARRFLKQCGELNWSEINPDIFGSMIQAVVDADIRSEMGMHYTSVPNIMKALQPLFLMSLEEEFENARDSEAKLKKLLQRIYNIRVFDPACGSGNFLIIAYRELRKLENRIFERLREVAKQWALPMTGVKLDHFFGIELGDFAAETAKLSLWIAEYQMNEQFKAMFGTAPPVLPLRSGGVIVHDNATRIEWDDVCPKGNGHEIYVVGNPPYLGARNQGAEQKSDMAHVFEGEEEYKDCDYVACWLLKAADYVAGEDASFALVTTNSVTQGEQVAYIWPRVLGKGLEIGFAHRAFKWANNAKGKAGVTCVIVGVRNVTGRPKYIYEGDSRRLVDNISPYLIPGQTVYVRRASTPLAALPKMVIGSMARDGGNLFLSPDEREKLLADHPSAEAIVKRAMGTDELISGKDRYCLWIEDGDLPVAEAIPTVRDRIEKVRAFRVASKAKTTNGYAKIPHKFAQRCLKEDEAIIVPSTSSERREYVPMDFLSPGVVITNLANAVYGAEPYVFGLLHSRLHMAWVRTVGGGFETRIRYTAEMCYNTFPVPELSARQKTDLEAAAMDILAAREAFPGKTLEWLYDPDTMPEDLLKAHRSLDEVVDRIYVGRPFRTDVERLEHLFRLYSLKTGKKDAGGAKKTKAVKGAA